MTDRTIKYLAGCALSAVLICMTPLYAADNALADRKHTEKEVRGLVAMTQQELDNLKKNKAVEITGNDITFIEKSLIKTKKLLDQKQIEDAFYQIEITRAIFEIVNARLELYYSKQILERLKTNKAAAQ